MSEFRGYMMIVGAALFWGVSATAAKHLQNLGVDTLLIVQTRVSFSAIFLLAFFALFRRETLRVKPGDLWRFALVGVIGVAGANYTYYTVIEKSTVATGILIQYTAPLFVMAYAIAVKEEGFGLVKLGAAVISLGGCFLAVGGYDQNVVKITPSVLINGAGSVFCFAFLTVYTRHLLRRYSLWTTSFYAIFFAACFWLVLNPPWKIAAGSLSPALWVSLAVLAVFSVLIPHSLFFGGLRVVVPSRAIITSTLEPVAAIVSAALLLAEHLKPLQVTGAGMVILAIVLLNFRPERDRAVQPAFSIPERDDAS
ncbi:MAG: EamA family transporter [Bacteroidota bacterium]